MRLFENALEASSHLSIRPVGSVVVLLFNRMVIMGVGLWVGLHFRETKKCSFFSCHFQNFFFYGQTIFTHFGQSSNLLRSQPRLGRSSFHRATSLGYRFALLIGLHSHRWPPKGGHGFLHT